MLGCEYLFHFLDAYVSQLPGLNELGCLLIDVLQLLLLGLERPLSYLLEVVCSVLVQLKPVAEWHPSDALEEPLCLAGDLLFVGDQAPVDVDIVLPEGAHGWPLTFVSVAACLVLLRSLAREVMIVACQALVPLHCVLKLELELRVERRQLEPNCVLSLSGEAVVSPPQLQLVAPVLQPVLPPLEEQA